MQPHPKKNYFGHTCSSFLGGGRSLRWHFFDFSSTHTLPPVSCRFGRGSYFKFHMRATFSKIFEWSSGNCKYFIGHSLKKVNILMLLSPLKIDPPCYSTNPSSPRRLEWDLNTKSNLSLSLFLLGIQHQMASPPPPYLEADKPMTQKLEKKDLRNLQWCPCASAEKRWEAEVIFKLVSD